MELALTFCVAALIITPTLGDPTTAAVFLAYRTLLASVAVLCAVASRNDKLRISRVFLGLAAAWILLALLSTARIPGSHFEGFSIFYTHVLFVAAFASFARYARAAPSRWKAGLLTVVIATSIIRVAPDLVQRRAPAAAFTNFNPDYFAAYLLVGFAAAVAAAIFATARFWRIGAAAAAALLFFGIVRTSSRGAFLAALAVAGLAAVRAGNRIPRKVWVLGGAGMIAIAIATSPVLVRKFLDRGEGDPYNYARIQIWEASLRLIGEHPLFGTGPGQFIHVSKRFTYPVEGQIARYEKHLGIAHSEYLQEMAEFGIPSALLLFSLPGCALALAWKRARKAAPDKQWFQEAAILTGAGLAAHGLVDNCWTAAALASGLVVIGVADVLPLAPRGAARSWGLARLAAVAAGIAAVYVHSTVIPALAFHYNQAGVRSLQQGHLDQAEHSLLQAVRYAPDGGWILDNLSKVYVAEFDRTRNADLLRLARESVERSITASPKAVEPRLRMEEVLIRSLTGDDKKDAEVDRKMVKNDLALLELDPSLPFPRKNLATAYYNLGDYPNAFAQMRKVLEYEPNYAPAYLELASWSGDRGDAAAKGRYAAKAMAIVSKYKDVRVESAYQGMLLGRPESEWK